MYYSPRLFPKMKPPTIPVAGLPKCTRQETIARDESSVGDTQRASGKNSVRARLNRIVGGKIFGAILPVLVLGLGWAPCVGQNQDREPPEQSDSRHEASLRDGGLPSTSISDPWTVQKRVDGW